MSTGTKVALAVVGVSLLYLVWQRQTSVAPSVAVAATAAAGPSTLTNAENTIGSIGGSVTANLIGAPAAAPLLAQAGRDYVGGEVTGFKEAGQGVGQIASGNVWTGTKNVAAGAFETAYAGTGAKTVVNGLKSLL